ncbi:hypothetical protein [Streptomyces halstedii]|uniref:Uncharacterized protein n=1 Tax=Streptomyces halstedii TaxID=1944 RepID=A0A6N9U551_STRHA|nr:hypothetical protein [Streptomyces halstedii]NEA18971.1 hypothetical protein [Streptomyces halstedii]
MCIEREFVAEQTPAAPHPDHAGLSALYMAELAVYPERWQLIVVAPGRGRGRRRPGRHLIAPRPEPQPVPPLTDVIGLLPAAGYTVDPAAWADQVKLHGWTQGTDTMWTAPYHPAAPSAQRL